MEKDDRKKVELGGREEKKFEIMYIMIMIMMMMMLCVFSLPFIIFQAITRISKQQGYKNNFAEEG
jgi:hypothetical protein